MASYMTDSYMAGTTISRHVGELVPYLTSFMDSVQDSKKYMDGTPVKMALSSAKHM